MYIAIQTGHKQTETALYEAITVTEICIYLEVVSIKCRRFVVNGFVDIGREVSGTGQKPLHHSKCLTDTRKWTPIRRSLLL